MKQFCDLSHSALIDMLAKHTALYTQLLSDNIKTDEFYKCRRLIEQLTTEIKSRAQAEISDNSTISTSVSFREE